MSDSTQYLPVNPDITVSIHNVRFMGMMWVDVGDVRLRPHSTHISGHRYLILREGMHSASGVLARVMHHAPEGRVIMDGYGNGDHGCGSDHGWRARRGMGPCQQDIPD